MAPKPPISGYFFINGMQFFYNFMADTEWGNQIGEGLVHYNAVSGETNPYTFSYDTTNVFLLTDNVPAILQYNGVDVLPTDDIIDNVQYTTRATGGGTDMTPKEQYQAQLTELANAINEKTGGTSPMTVAEMADNIRSISTGSDVQQTNGFYSYSYVLGDPSSLAVGQTNIAFNDNYVGYFNRYSYIEGQMIIDTRGVIARCTSPSDCTIVYIPTSGSSSEPQEYETLLSGEHGTIYRGGSQTFNINTMTAGLTRAEIVAFTFHCQGSRMSGGGSQYSQDFQIPLDTIYRQDFDMGGGECTYGNLLNGNMEIRFTKPSVSYENETTNYATNITIDAATCTDFDYISVSLGFVYKGFKFANGGTY